MEQGADVTDKPHDETPVLAELDEETALLVDGEAAAGGVDDAEGRDGDEVAHLERLVESILFASGAPISFRKLLAVLDGPTAQDVHRALERLKETYGPGRRGIQLHEVAGGFQLRTARENAAWVRTLFREKPTRLGRAALETLAVVAYRQPVTKAEIESIRGVDVDGTLTTLMGRKLIKTAGRKEAIGRPLLYATSAEFLEVFGLKDLNDLPSLKELGPAPDADYSEALDAQSTTPSEPTPAATGHGEHDARTNPGHEVGGEQAGGDGDATPAEDPEPVGDQLATQGGGDDPGGPGEDEWPRGAGAGDEGEPEDRSDHD